MSNVFTACENCKAQFPHELLTKCAVCGSEQVWIDTEIDNETNNQGEENDNEETSERDREA